MVPKNRRSEKYCIEKFNNATVKKRALPSSLPSSSAASDNVPVSQGNNSQRAPEKSVISRDLSLQYHTLNETQEPCDTTLQDSGSYETSEELNNISINIQTLTNDENRSIFSNAPPIPAIPHDILQGIFRKATDLLREDGAVVRAPTPDESYSVKSSTNPRQPHLTQKKGVKVSCDIHCEGYRAFELCAHSLAVASHTNILEKYITSYNEKKTKKTNLLKLSTTGLPKSRGRKVKSTNKRKFGPKATSDRPVVDIVSSSLSGVSTFPTRQSFFESSFEDTGSPSKSAKKSLGNQYMTCVPPKNVQKKIKDDLIIPVQPVVHVGQTLGIMPPQVEPQDQPYELMQRRGHISRCNGCRVKFNKNDPELFVLGRSEFEWYPKVQNNSKFYKVGSAKNFYYCIQRRCLLMRRSMLNSLNIVYVGTDDIPEKVRNYIKEQFGVDHLIKNWVF